MAITKLNIKTATEGMHNKKFSATELVMAYIEEAKSNSHLNCFITETFESAIAQAKIADERIASGNVRFLEGIPIAIKDLFCTKNIRTTAGSKILENFVPKYESRVTKLLCQEAGAISLGKLNMDEFAMGSSTENSAYGPTINPIKRSDGAKLVPGGSSGGSAAAVAANICTGALGSDTGGSIRQPASVCGIFGINPTYGRVSRNGVIAFASSLDRPGVLTRTVEDGAYLLQAISGHDLYDPTSAKEPVPDWINNINSDIKGIRIGIPKEYMIEGVSNDVIKAWNKAEDILRSYGAEIVHISLPHTKYALPTYYIIAPAEASSNLMRYDGVKYGLRVEDAKDLSEMYRKTRARFFGDEVKRRILIGTYALSAEHHDKFYIQAQKVRRLIAKDFADVFGSEVDAILTPSTPGPAFALGEKLMDPIQMYASDVFTVPASLAGVPCSSVPGMLSNDGLPIGIQVIANKFDELTVFKVSKALEEALRIDLSDNK